MAWAIRRGEFFYLGWNDPHTKRDRYKSLRTTDEKAAQLAVKKKEIELGERSDDSMVGETVEAPGGLTIDGLISRYVKDTKLSESTRRNNRYAWNHFKTLTGKTLVHEVKKETAIDFITKLEGKKYSDTYIGMCLRDMRKLWKYAIDEEVVSMNPFKKVPLPTDSQVARDVTAGDEQLILECATPWLKRFIQIQRLTGLRPGQVALLDWKNISLRRMTIHVLKFKRQPERIIPIFDDLLTLLGPEKHSGAVLPEFDGRTPAQARNKFNREWQRAYRRAVKKGLKGRFRAYDLRHAKASELSQKLSPHELADYFGWSTVKMTDRYVHTRLETIRQKLTKSPPSPPPTPA